MWRAFWSATFLTTRPSLERMAGIRVVGFATAIACASLALPALGEAAVSAQQAPDVQTTLLGTAGKGVANVSRASELVGTGYVERKYLMSGTGRLFSGSTSTAATPTGQTSAYTTRILVRAPSRASRFSGRVVVEPFNTSGQADID